MPYGYFATAPGRDIAASPALCCPPQHPAPAAGTSDQCARGAPTTQQHTRHLKQGHTQGPTRWDDAWLEMLSEMRMSSSWRTSRVISTASTVTSRDSLPGSENRIAGVLPPCQVTCTTPVNPAQGWHQHAACLARLRVEWQKRLQLSLPGSICQRTMLRAMQLVMLHSASCRAALTCLSRCAWLEPDRSRGQARNICRPPSDELASAP